jgi:hypothetical protein
MNPSRHATPAAYAWLLGRRNQPRREVESLCRLFPHMAADLRAAYRNGLRGEVRS